MPPLGYAFFKSREYILLFVTYSAWSSTWTMAGIQPMFVKSMNEYTSEQIKCGNRVRAELTHQLHEIELI